MTKFNWAAGLGVVVALACGSESGAPSVSTDPVTADDAVSDSGSMSDAGGIRNPVVPTIPRAPVPVDAGLPPPPTIVDAGTPLPPPALADAGEPVPVDAGIPPPAQEPDAGEPAVDAGVPEADAGLTLKCDDQIYLGDLIANCTDLEFHIELEPRKAWCKCKAYYWADRKTCDQMQHDPVTEDELAAMNAACPKPPETIP